jgi:hypothetical protein
LATLAVAGAVTLDVDTVVPVRVAVGVAPAVRVELVVARAGDPEMLAGGLTTAAAVGDNVRTLANPVGAETALLVGVMTLDGAITGAAALVTFVLGLAVVVPVTTADEPAMVDAAVKPVLPAPVVSTELAATLLVASGSPAPLRMASVGPE